MSERGSEMFKSVKESSQDQSGDHNSKKSQDEDNESENDSDLKIRDFVSKLVDDFE